MGAVARLTWLGVRRRGAGQVVALVLVTALASAAVVAGLAGQRSTATLVDAAYKRLGRPDIVLYGTPEGLEAAAADPAVVAASAPARLRFADVVRGTDRTEADVAVVDPSAPQPVGGPLLVEGRWPQGDDEVVVERSVVVAGVVDVGGSLRLEAGPGSGFDARVVGTVTELSDCFFVNDQCDPLRLFGTEAFVDRLPASDRPTFRASYRIAEPDHAAAVATRMLQAGGPAVLYGQNTWPDTRADIVVIGEVFGAMVAGSGALLLAAACFVVAGATAARLVARRRSLGLLRAVGFRPSQVTLAVLAEHLVLGAAGVVAGWVVGSRLAPQLSQVDRVLDATPDPYSVGTLVIALVLVETFLALALVVPAWRAGREPATAVLRDVPPMPTGGRRVAALARRFGAGPSLVAGLRRAVARPVRAVLAGGAIFVAVVGVIGSAGFIGAVGDTVDDPARIGDPWDARVFTGDADAPDLLDALPAVESWHTERDANAAIGPATFHAIVTGGDPSTIDYRVQEGRPLRGPGEAIVGYGFLQETGLAVGDRVAIALNGTPIDLQIVGWYFETADSGKVIQLREESVPPGVLSNSMPSYNVVAADGLDRDELAASLRVALGEQAVVVTLDPDDDAFRAISGTLAGFAALLVAVAAANLLATTVAATRERARALGVMRTLGCTTRQLVAQSAAGAAFVGAIAAVAGVPAGLVIFRLLADAITAGVGLGPGMAALPPVTLLLALVPLAIAVAAASGALAALGLSRKPAAELVRYE